MGAAAATVGARGDKDRAGADDDHAIEVIGAEQAGEGADTTGEPRVLTAGEEEGVIVHEGVEGLLQGLGRAAGFLLEEVEQGGGRLAVFHLAGGEIHDGGAGRVRDHALIG